MKKLPKIYKSDYKSITRNNKKSCLVSKCDSRDNSLFVSKTLDEIFLGFKPSKIIPVSISTKNKNYDTYLIARGLDSVVTIDKERIFIDDIISINIKKPN